MRAAHRGRWFPPEGPGGWLALAALGFLLLVAAADAGLWYARLWGRFYSKANFVSHFWPYVALAGMVAGLFARGAPNILRSLPTAWLLLSLVVHHRGQVFPKPPPPPPAGPTFKVMTLNLSDQLEKRPAAIDYLRKRRDVDVLFLQEVHGTALRGDRPLLEQALGRRLPHMAWREGPRKTLRRFGLGIMSRFPLGEVEVIDLPPGPAPRGVCHDVAVLLAKADVRGRPVRLASTHLCPPRLPWRDAWNRRVGLSLGGVWDWLGSLRLSEYARRSQLIFLRLVAEGGVAPIVLGGDLNTTNRSMDLLHLSRRLHSAFDERGLGFGFTFYVGFVGARIDHVFFSGELRVRASSVAEVDISDHRPLDALLEILPPSDVPPLER